MKMGGAKGAKIAREGQRSQMKKHLGSSPQRLLLFGVNIELTHNYSIPPHPGRSFTLNSQSTGRSSYNVPTQQNSFYHNKGRSSLAQYFTDL